MRESKLSQDERKSNQDLGTRPDGRTLEQPPPPQLAGHIWLLAFMFLVLVTVVLLT